jgi:hypothetical protein
MHHRSPAPVVGRLLSTLVTAALCAATTVAQAPTAFPAPPKLAAGFDVATATVQALQPAAAGGQIAVPFVLAGVPRTMVLHPHEVRSPTFQLLLQDATGTHVLPSPPCTTYRGELLEEPDTKVAASVVGGAVTAIVRRPGPLVSDPSEDWVVQPAREVDPTAGATVHVVYRATDTLPLPFHCGNGPGAPAPVGGGVDTTFECDLAIEADVEFFQQNGSNATATQNDVTAVINQVEFIYDRDCDIQYAVTAIVVNTTAVYSTNDPGSLLGQFANRWNTVNAGIPRDLAHLFTGRNLSGSTIGIAQLASVCSLGVAYGLSQSRFTSNFNSRVGLTCHEIGHGWSAQHCDAVSPCYIMCAGLGGCSNNVTLFGPTERAQITSFAASRSCLSIVPQAPQITAASPSSVTVFAPGNLVLTGSGFTGATSYRVGTQVFTTGFSVSSDTTMSVTMPQGAAIGPTTVAVTNGQGTSNAFATSYTLTAPPKLRATAVVQPSGGLASFDFAGTPGRSWFLVLGLTPTTSPFQGFPLLSPQLLLTAGTFPAPLGISNVTVPVPGGLGFLLLYLQVLEANALPAATGTTNVATIVLL